MTDSSSESVSRCLPTGEGAVHSAQVWLPCACLLIVLGIAWMVQFDAASKNSVAISAEDSSRNSFSLHCVEIPSSAETMAAEETERLLRRTIVAFDTGHEFQLNPGVITLKEPTSLTDGLELLREQIYSHQKFRISILADHESLGVNNLAEMKVNACVPKVPNQSAEHYLEWLLQVMEDPLDYVVTTKGQVLVTTRNRQAGLFYERAYNIATVKDLFAPSHKIKVDPALFPLPPLNGGQGTFQPDQRRTGAGGGFGFFRVNDASNIPASTKWIPTATVRELTSSDSNAEDRFQQLRTLQNMNASERLIWTLKRLTWPVVKWQEVDQEGGIISSRNEKILVVQNRRGHRAIRDILEALCEYSLQ
ncbi:MAG: hypothetical protein KDA91_12920 [Planctomycetaceae bacterium]|nr:hypothetical protein [Planctomycetaceae bacterium]